MKKSIALLLCLCMLMAMFAACGSDTTTADSAAPAGEASAADAADDAAPADAASADTAEPAGDAAEAAAPADGTADSAEPADDAAPVSEGGLITTDYTYDLPLFPDDPDWTFSMWVSFSDSASNYMPNQFADNRAYLKSVELTGVNVDMVCISTSSNSEQFNLRVASGDLPNVITNVAQLWDGSFDSAIDDEVFIDLTELVENYMPAYYECYQQLTDDEKKQLHTDEGNFPKLISINNYPDGATEGAFIRTDFLEKVGLDIPQTYDELDNVLYTFQSELGLSEPLMAVAGLVHTSNALCSGYGVNGGFSTFPMFADPYYIVDGEIRYGIIEDGYKEYMEMFHKYYADGIISPDFISKNTNPMEFIGTITSGTTGVFFGETGMVANYIQQGVTTDPDFAIYPLAPITKTPGEATHFANAKNHLSGRLAGISVSTAEVDLEKLGTYLDFFFTEEGALLSAMGVEDTADTEGSYVWENGKLAYSDAWNNSELSDMEKPTYWIYSVMPMLCPETPKTYTEPLQYECADVWDTNADSAYQLPEGVSMTVDEQSEYNAIYGDIRTLVEENLSKFAVGDRDMSEWDSFIKDLKDLGIERCIEIEQDAVDRVYNRSL